MSKSLSPAEKADEFLRLIAEEAHKIKIKDLMEPFTTRSLAEALRTYRPGWSAEYPLEGILAAKISRSIKLCGYTHRAWQIVRAEWKFDPHELYLDDPL